ncbi:MAG TPA: hypothetical protein PLV92_11865, partial [Pirellulaceae bacterium]|nr:hypothetical protein [Pirellulaceae bacterium]
RLINQICDAALLFAAQSGVGAVTDQIVEQAWADLQQIPTPWQTPPIESHSSSSKGAAPSSVIEFGQLNDDFGSIASFEPLADAGPPQLQSSTELEDHSESTTRAELAADVKDVDESRADEGFASAPDASIVVVDSWLPDIAVKLPRRSEAPTAARVSANGPSSSPASRPANRPVANESNNATQTAPPAAPHKPSSVAAVGSIPVTGSVPSADQLFGSDYLEEEVVIDRYASLEMMAIAERLKVSCREGREIAASLSSLTTPLARRTTAGGPTSAFTSLAAESRAAFGITGPTDGLRPVVEEWLEPIGQPDAWEATASSPAAPAGRATVEFEPTVAVIGIDATDSPAAAIVAAGQAEIDAESMPVQRDSQVRVAAAATSQAIITGPIDSPHHSQLCNPVVAENESRPTVAPAAIERETVAHEAVAHEAVPNVGLSGADVHPSHVGASGAAVRMRPHVRVAATDDRDLLVVEEDGTTHPPVDPDQGRARRQEYRSLFARLRARS